LIEFEGFQTKAMADARFSPSLSLRVGAQRLKSVVLRSKKYTRSGMKPDSEVVNMESVKDISKAFIQARIVGEKLLEQGRITWESYAIVMIGFEEKLKTMGEVI
jgi:hypothetical protein